MKRKKVKKKISRSSLPSVENVKKRSLGRGDKERVKNNFDDEGRSWKAVNFTGSLSPA